MLTQQILEKHFPIPITNEYTDFQQFRQDLVDSIVYLLQYDVERLAQAMYQIDVGEEVFRTALYAQDAVRLADLAIERVSQKRQVYPQKI